MATHKVPQDVEADDKLVGFLSLKQFIFVILGIGFGWLTFVFATKVHVLAALIWVPPTVVFLVLGLYQRKDQPVEVFLASALRFYLKPHTRMWNQEGYEERVIITAPPKYEKRYTKEFGSEEASSRLHALSHLMDSRGWTTKVAADWQNPQLATAAASDRLVQPGQVHTAAVDIQQYTQPVDVMDEVSSPVAQDFQNRINQTDDDARQHALQTVQSARQTPPSSAPISDNNMKDDGAPTVTPVFHRYPEMHQKVISSKPTTETPTPTAVEPSKTPITAEVAPKHITKQKKPDHSGDSNSIEVQLR